MTQPALVICTLERHGASILAILNEAIETSTALYDYRPRPPDSMPAWFDAKRKGGFPVLGVEGDDGSLQAFGSYGSFRAWPAYKYTVEHSVYVHRDHRGAGLGRVVLKGLIDAAQARDLHCMVGGIDAGNQASIKLHEALGFRHVGTLSQVGFKFGRWLNLAFYQRLLATPTQPTDG